MGREKEKFVLTDEPIRICHTASDRVPWITNSGDVPIMLDVMKWPADRGLTLAPGVTVPFVNPMPATDAAPVFASAPSGKGEIEYLFLR